MKKDNVSVQVRLPAQIHDYIKSESKRMGLSLNSVIVRTLDDGRKLQEAKITVDCESPL